ncbi:MAG: U32 family peptidase [Leptospirales bacterium]|nr:U32 family peptidase [Leptospirales bacterium]
MSTQEKKHPEILAPAGNLDKLRFAVHYGADAVYLGGSVFNLRIRAGNFTRAELELGIDFCRQNGVKSIFLLNAFLRENDIAPLKEYIKDIKNLRFDACVVSDPGMLLMLREAGIEAEFHLSTQMNTLNHMSVKFWEDAGISRVVLGREASLEEIRAIRANTKLDIEIFAHGALCVAYSGRCLLSRYLAGRDANQGDCAQPCRWKYRLIEEKREDEFFEITEDEGGTEILSSKDLCLIEFLPDYIKAGVSSFKIEGRMKSLYYTANTTRVYAQARDNAESDNFTSLLPFWKEELELVSHRPYTADLFNEFDRNGFTGVPYINKAMFMGYKLSTGDDKRVAQVKTANPIYINDELEAIFPLDKKNRDAKFRVLKIFDSNNASLEMARPNGFYNILFDADVDDYAIFRKRETGKNQ